MAALITEDRNVSVYETEHWTELASFPVPALVEQVAFSTDDSQLTVCNGAGLVDIWDLRLIRKNLAAMGLDLPLPPIPPPTNTPIEKPLRWVFVTNAAPKILSPVSVTVSVDLPK